MKNGEKGFTLMELLITLGIVVVLAFGVFKIFNIKPKSQILLEEIQKQAKETCESSTKTSGKFTISKEEIPEKLYKELGSQLNNVKEHLVKWRKVDGKCQFRICLSGKGGNSASIREHCTKWIDIPKDKNP